MHINKGTQEYIEKQNEWIKLNDVKIGDLVEILPFDGDSKGWRASWVDTMNECIGQKGVIRIVYDCGSGMCVDMWFDSWSFPYFALKLIKKITSKKEVEETKHNVWLLLD